MIHERGWQCFATYGDEVAASVVVDYFRRNGCPAQVSPDLGTGVRVMVPGELLHRAKWLWSQADLSEAELQYMISGVLPSGN
jgi:hypothetical protein